MEDSPKRAGEFMKNKVPRSNSRFFQTWKSLLISIYFFSILAFVMSFIGKIHMNHGTLFRGGLGLSVSGTIIMMIDLICYVNNFKFLKNKGENLNHKQFVIGLLPAVTVLLLNIFVLIIL